MDEQLTDEEAGKIAGKIAREKMAELLDQRPATRLNRVLLRLGQLVNAKKIQFFAHQGEVLSSRTTTDNTTRLAAIRTALELYDAFPARRHELTADLDFREIPEEEKEALKAVAKEIARQQIKKTKGKK